MAPDAPIPDGGPEPESDEERSRFAALRERFLRSEAQVEAKYDEIKGRRGESTPIDIAFRVVETDRRVAGGLIAGGMAFRIFVVMIPFAFVIVTAMGFFGEAVNSNDPVALAQEAGMTGLVAHGDQRFARRLDHRAHRHVVLRDLRLVLGDVDVDPRDACRPRPRVGIGRAPPHHAAVAPRALRRHGNDHRLASRVSGRVDCPIVIDPLAEIVARILFLGVIIGAWLGVSWVLPRASGTTWRSLIPGAVLFGVGVEILQFLTVYFFSRYIANKTDTYGTIGASIAILLWAYLGGRLIVTGAFLNAARWRQSQEQANNGPRCDAVRPSRTERVPVDVVDDETVDVATVDTEALTAGHRRVGDQLEASLPLPQVVGLGVQPVHRDLDAVGTGPVRVDVHAGLRGCRRSARRDRASRSSEA